MRLTEKELDDILKKGHAKIRSEASIQTSDTKLDVGHKQVEKKKIARFTSPVNL